MRLLQIAVLVCHILIVSVLANDSFPKVEHTTNKYRGSMEQLFKRASVALSIDKAGAHFQTRPDGPKFCLGDPRKGVHATEFQFDFTLSKPGEVFFSPDHHESRIFTVKRVDPDKVVLQYETEFDHRSFGKNLITTDSGEIKLSPLKNQ